MSPDDFHARVLRLRLDRGLTQDQLARRVDVSSNMPANWERPGGVLPSYESLQGLVVVLGTNADYLLGFTDDPRPRPGARRDQDEQFTPEDEPGKPARGGRTSPRR